jgi:hypothetical protein
MKLSNRKSPTTIGLNVKQHCPGFTPDKKNELASTATVQPAPRSLPQRLEGVNKLAHYIEVYRREIYLETHRQNVPFHLSVLDDAVAALSGTETCRTAAIAEIASEMTILRIAQKGSFVRLSQTKARKEAMRLLEGSL